MKAYLRIPAGVGRKWTLSRNDNTLRATKPSNPPSSSIKTKTTKNKSSSRYQSCSHCERIQSVSSDVFNSSLEMDGNNFELPNNKRKPHLSIHRNLIRKSVRKINLRLLHRIATLHSPQTTLLACHLQYLTQTTNNTINCVVDQLAKIKLPPSIFEEYTTLSAVVINIWI